MKKCLPPSFHSASHLPLSVNPAASVARQVIKYLVILCALVSTGLVAQNVPQGINYQAIARDATGAIMANQAITVKFKLFNSFGASGTPNYEEDHAITTNSLGYFNAVIGQGTPVTGSFGTVNWSTGNASYEVYLNGSLLGSETKFFSAPYALYAQQANGAVTYQAGSGIAISGGTVTNTAPNQTVTITGPTVTGAYPSYTVGAASYQAGTGIAITGGTLTNTAPNQTVAITGPNVTGAYPSYTITPGNVLPTGTANGNTLRWNSVSTAWQESPLLYNDNQHVGVGTGSAFSGKFHVHHSLNTDSSSIFADHLNAVARTAGVRSYVQGTSALGQYNTAIMGGHFRAKNLGQGSAVGVIAEGDNSVAGGTAVGLYATTYGTSTDRWAAMFDKGGVKINDSLVFGGPGATGSVLTRSSSGRAVWTLPSALGDNLGNHTMTQNLHTNGFYISSAGAANGIFIDPSGRVAVASNSPVADLDVNGGIRSAGSKLFLGAMNGVNSGYTGIYENGGDLRFAVFKSGGPTTSFGSNTIDEATIKSNSGRMGINTMAPAYMLHVNGAIHTDSLINVNGVPALPPVSPAGQGRIFFDGTKFKVSENGGPYVYLLPSNIWTRSGALLYNTNLGDNVGIGTATPAFRLDVAGTAQVSDNTTSSGYVATIQNNVASGISGGALNVMSTGARSIDNSAMIIQNQVTKVGGSNSTKTGLNIQSTGSWAPGTGQTNVGLAVNVSGADNNYSAVFMGGAVGIGTATPATSLDVNGYTKLGTTAPLIQMQKFTATTASTQGSSTSITLGITTAKILSVSVMVQWTGSAGDWIQPDYTVNPGYQFFWFISGPYLYVVNSTGNSGSILSKPIQVLITYEQ